MERRGQLKKEYYNKSLKLQKQTYYEALPEKAKRHFLGQEYLSLGVGSQRYLSIVFNCSRQTIKKGLDEVQSPDFNPNYERQRSKGGGRKKKEEEYVDLAALILEIVSTHTAGSPTDDRIKWTDFRPCDIKEKLKEQEGITISHSCIKRVLKTNGYVKRKPVKSISIGESKHRAEQFKIVCHLISLVSMMPYNPILSVDTKKKERLGTLTRNEQVLAQKDNIPKVF